MEEKKLDTLMMLCGDKLPATSYRVVKECFAKAQDMGEVNFVVSQFKDPAIALVLALTIPGVDRIYIGDTLLGILKLITCGGLLIWWIVDIFLIMDAAKEKNFEKVMTLS